MNTVLVLNTQAMILYYYVYNSIYAALYMNHHFDIIIIYEVE